MSRYGNKCRDTDGLGWKIRFGYRPRSQPVPIPDVRRITVRDHDGVEKIFVYGAKSLVIPKLLEYLKKLDPRPSIRIEEGLGSSLLGEKHIIDRSHQCTHPEGLEWIRFGSDVYCAKLDPVYNPMPERPIVLVVANKISPPNLGVSHFYVLPESFDIRELDLGTDIATLRSELSVLGIKEKLDRINRNRCLAGLNWTRNPNGYWSAEVQGPFRSLDHREVYT